MNIRNLLNSINQETVFNVMFWWGAYQGYKSLKDLQNTTKGFENTVLNITEPLYLALLGYIAYHTVRKAARTHFPNQIDAIGNRVQNAQDSIHLWYSMWRDRGYYSSRKHLDNLQMQFDDLSEAEQNELREDGFYDLYYKYLCPISLALMDKPVKLILMNRDGSNSFELYNEKSLLDYFRRHPSVAISPVSKKQIIRIENLTDEETEAYRDDIERLKTKLNSNLVVKIEDGSSKLKQR